MQIEPILRKYIYYTIYNIYNYSNQKHNYITAYPHHSHLAVVVRYQGTTTAPPKKHVGYQIIQLFSWLIMGRWLSNNTII